ncbi:SGNH/GDSL hydrolase family protein [Zunongwangia pacifica]|uniref:SGNH/GDSL hydrolase family protein n=1 Tax=Zunongwangia pacifica TaxID=2911062 RepID=A0A9X2CMF8_9FLAO|nr:SGNH/GDSL hydrolase family protein [Zunongwangia pacifica]MCL6217454.1 SGNH/GDSL hydrolase family protein [Zunongwangia pacifica]
MLEHLKYKFVKRFIGKRNVIFAFFLIVLVSCGTTSSISKNESENQQKWVGSWSTAPQLVEPRNVPPAPGLTGNTLRQIISPSLGGKTIRLKFSNEFSDRPVEMRSVEIAIAKSQASIEDSTVKTLTFDGQPGVIMPAGAAVFSDALDFEFESRTRLAITIKFGETVENITGHPGSRTTSYLVEGNQNTTEKDFENAIKTDHWYVINTLEVMAGKNASAIAILGNSITDGRGSGTNKQNRWPDILAERLIQHSETKSIGVLNMGIGGNAVLRGGLGPTGLNRFDRDILSQSAVKYLIILEGVNDLGATPDSTVAFKVANNLIDAYQTMIHKAHAKNIKVYGGTITPIKKSFYYKDFREQARQKVNHWIRNSGAFDAVIDFAEVLESPEEPNVLAPNLHSGDYLHPNEKGYEVMGEAIDLSLFRK